MGCLWREKRGRDVPLPCEYLEEQEYDSLLDARLEQLSFRKDKDGNYGTALLAIHPDERARLESGSSGVSISERSTGTSQYSQR